MPRIQLSLPTSTQPGATSPLPLAPPHNGQDRDHAPKHWDDPHQTSPPHGRSDAPQPPAAGASFLAHQPPAAQQQQQHGGSADLSSLSTSDMEFGSDALTGSTLETPDQEAKHHEVTFSAPAVEPGCMLRPNAACLHGEGGWGWEQGCKGPGRVGAHPLEAPAQGATPHLEVTRA